MDGQSNRFVRILQLQPADEEIISLGLESRTKQFSLLRENCFVNPIARFFDL